MNNNDVKSIEEKALNFFKVFIEDSKVVSQYIAENDKEPIWDGFLYLYSGGIRDKEHFIGRVPVQIKGVEVDDFKIEKWKYRIKKCDLRAYLYEPTFFIVCQLKKGTKEKKLFYRAFLPDTVKRLLNDMGGKKTCMTRFNRLTEDLTEFEEQMVVFYRNGRKMIGFVNSKPFTMQDAKNRGIKNFSFVAPATKCKGLNLFKYLSTHETRLYAKIDNEFDINMPISDGPVRMSFCRNEVGDVRVGERVFYNAYKNEIEDGRIKITVADCLFMNLPIDETDNRPPTVKFTSRPTFLTDAIKMAEFVIALHEFKKLAIGEATFGLVINEPEFVEVMRGNLQYWRELQALLDKMNVTKPLNIREITEEQEFAAGLLLESIGRGNVVKMKEKESGLKQIKIGNINLLLWCLVNSNGDCRLGDYFDGSISISYNLDGVPIRVSPYSYLQNGNLWELCDNIKYSDIVACVSDAVNDNGASLELANADVLAMIKASDAVADSDKDKSLRLLSAAMDLCLWLMKNGDVALINIYYVNKMQIIKRQRAFTKNEIEELESLLRNDNTENSIKTAVALLLGQRDVVDNLMLVLPKEEQDALRLYPIWKFYAG